MLEVGKYFKSHCIIDKSNIPTICIEEEKNTQNANFVNLLRQTQKYSYYSKYLLNYFEDCERRKKDNIFKLNKVIEYNVS